MRGYTALIVLVAAIVETSYAGHRYGGFSGAQRGDHGRFSGAHGGGHGYSQENYGPPSPYQFGYSSEDQEGTHGHSQSSDGRRVQGHYVIQLADGRQRRVDYYADETGFHAKVNTNELGTESKDAADSIYQSSAITGERAALQYGGGSKSAYGSGRHGGRSSGHSNSYNKW